MSRPDRPVHQPEPDVDQLLDAAVTLIAAATYADAVRRMDEVAITSAYRDWPAGAVQLRTDANVAEETARDALFELLDHQRVMRLIPELAAARWKTSRRAEDDYRQLTDSHQATSDLGDLSDVDGVS